MDKITYEMSILFVLSLMGLFLYLNIFILPDENIDISHPDRCYYLYFEKKEIIDISDDTLYFKSGDITLPGEYKGKINNIRSVGYLLDPKTRKGGFICFFYENLQGGYMLIKRFRPIRIAKYTKIGDEIQYQQDTIVLEIIDFEVSPNIVYFYSHMKKIFEFTFIGLIPITLILLKNYYRYQGKI